MCVAATRDLNVFPASVAACFRSNIFKLFTSRTTFFAFGVIIIILKKETYSERGFINFITLY